eukprot:4512954-Pyramimonas_sp.AAC.1
MGDWNCMALREARYHAASGAAGPVGSRPATAFNQQLGMLCEVMQEKDTHRIVGRFEGEEELEAPKVSLGRLDRIFTTLAPQGTLDLCPWSGTAWPITDLAAPAD